MNWDLEACYTREDPITRQHSQRSQCLVGGSVVHDHACKKNKKKLHNGILNESYANNSCLDTHV